MKRYFSFFVVPYVVLLGIVLTLLSGYPKAELHLMLNSCHTDVLDVFMKYYSKLAEWPLYVIAAVPLLFKRWRVTVFYLCCELSSAAIVQVLKHVFHAPRPATYFKDIPDVLLPVVDGVHLHHSNSFPSGHTSTFFVFFTVCALLLSYRYAKAKVQNSANDIARYAAMFLLFAVAAVGGYSRIYLSQHFLADVCVGSIIGVVVPCVLWKKVMRF